MGEEQMDLIVGVDFGMTCTGEICTGTQEHGIGIAQQPQPLTPNFRSIVLKPINSFQYYQMDSELARKSSRKREQSSDGPCVPKKRHHTRVDTVVMGLSPRDCGRAE